MGKDFRIGLVVGLVLAVAVLVWVATRPSLNPQVRRGPVPQLSQAEHQALGLSPVDAALSGEAAPPSVSPSSEIPNPQPRRAAAERGSGPTEVPESVKPQSAIINPPSALPDLTVYEKPEKIKTTKFHIVRRGESLASIARQYYGTPEAWRKILAANQKVIQDPSKIAPGTKLIIPE